jgi:tellurite resistance protein
MVYSSRLRSRRHDAQPEVVLIPGQRTMDGIIRAGALVALADGAVDPSERRALIGFLRRTGLLARYGRRNTLELLDQATTRQSADHLAALCEAADALRPCAGSTASALIARAARQVMLADGVAWPQELAMVRIIEDRLGLAFC